MNIIKNYIAVHNIDFDISEINRSNVKQISSIFSGNIKKDCSDGLLLRCAAIYNYNKGDKDKAIEKYKLSIENGDILSNYYLGTIYHMDKNVDDALTYYLKFIEIKWPTFKKYGDVHYNIALIYEGKNDLDNAIENYKKAIEYRTSKISYAKNNLGMLYKKKGDKKLAYKYLIECCNEMNSLSSSSICFDGLTNLAMLYESDGNTDKAMDYYKHAVRLNDLNAVYNLGQLYFEMGQWNLAIKMYEKCIENEDYTAYNNMGLAYEEMEDYYKAKKYYEKGVEHGIVESMYNLALIYDNENDIENATKMYMKAADKGWLEAVYNLAALYQRTNNTIMAAKYMNIHDEWIKKGRKTSTL